MGLRVGVRVWGKMEGPPISSLTTCTVPVGWGGWLLGLGEVVTAACV